MSRHLRALLLATVVLGLPVLCPAAAAQAATVIRQRLASGLTVLVRENPTPPVVTVSLQVRMGARWEQAENAGISNLLHQVMVKGTKLRTALEITEAVEGMGGTIGASGDTDFSEIRGTALARHWRGLLEVVADVALRPTLAAHEIENERRAVLSQIRNRQDHPFSLAFDTLLQSLYGPHPYGLHSLGRRESVERLDRSALLEHYRRHYRGDRMVLAVSGQVVAGEVLSEVSQLFSELPSGRDVADPAVPPPAPEESRKVLEHPAAQAQVVFGYLAPPLSHPDYPAVKVLSALLGGGMSGRLFAKLRDKQGLAYVVGALYPSRRDPSFFAIHTGTAPHNLAQAEEGIRMEVERVRWSPALAEEVARAKAYLLGTLALDRRTNARYAWYLAFFELEGVGHDFLDRYAAGVEAVTPEDVQRVAQTYLSRATITVLSPPAR
ncbi:MAG: insulinase family protein [Candidatus Rokubacteria bacterium]|nr:insulinase family protein [Candidatus Rokubacteria bacterium]